MQVVVGCCVLCNVCYFLFSVRCLLFVVCCLLCADRCVVFVVSCCASVVVGCLTCAR